MDDSILNSIKKVLNLAPSFTAFDEDIIMHINTAFNTLTQLGIGPVGGYQIEDSSNTWDEFLGDDIEYNQVKSYVYLRTKFLFDPPSTHYLVLAQENQISQLEWRLSIHREELSG